MITYEEFKEKYLGGSWGYPNDNYYKGECLSVCKLYVKEVFGINPPASGSGSAYGYWENFPNPLGDIFEKVVNTPELIPGTGWIVIWKPWAFNQWGHIAIVDIGSTKSILVNSAQNWTSKTYQIERNKYTNVIGYLKPKGVIIGDSMTEEQKRILEFLTGKTEGDVREAFGYLADKAKHNEQMATLSQKIIELDKFTKGLQEKIDILGSEVSASNEIIDKWQQEAKTAKEQAGSAIAQIQTANEDKNKYRRLYEGLLDKTANKLSVLDLLKLVIKKLSIKKQK